jgi:hypothetical protein
LDATRAILDAEGILAVVTGLDAGAVAATLRQAGFQMVEFLPSTVLAGEGACAQIHRATASPRTTVGVALARPARMDTNTSTPTALRDASPG